MESPDFVVGAAVRDVETAGQLMRRFYGTAKETMRAMAGYLPKLRSWPAKQAVARHIWLDAMHADSLRARALDLRYPRVDVDDQSDFHWIAFLRHLPAAPSDEAFLTGVYRVVKPALLEALRRYAAGSDKLDDAPSHVYIRRMIPELEEELAEAEALLGTFSPEAVAAAEDWRALVARLAEDCGGVDGPDRESGFVYPQAPYRIPPEAGRDPAWEPAVMQVPPRDPRNEWEHRVWIAIDHANEIWAAETAAALIWEYPRMPWNLYLDAARWCYDEMRHAMMGDQRLLALGLTPGIDTPMVPDHWRAFRERGIFELALLLHGLEQKGPLHKAHLRKELLRTGDTAGAQDCDYDWADESNHISFGLAWIKAVKPDWPKDRIMSETQRIVDEWRVWIQDYHRSGKHGYEPFMARIEAKSPVSADSVATLACPPTHLT